MRLTLLGTGTSFGVPQLGCPCNVCKSKDPRDTRGRSGAVLDDGATRILIDTPPELRVALLREGIGAVSAVLYTHDHADHTHGIDDLRALSAGARGPLPIFATRATIGRMTAKFPYVFDPNADQIPGSARTHVSIRPIEAGEPVDIGSIRVLPLAFEHGPTTTLGFRFGPLAYLTDLKRVGPEALAALSGVEVLVLGALFHRPHPTHLSIPEAVATARQLGARQTWLTHLTHETGHAELAASLPADVQPAHDGLVIEV
ncbi:MAG TPA: MBL fold metallo-hydrolase [Dongiaceae bacterium]|nr:MBL fold metallo-hydrolase [Dongiaceae bacterium]